MGAKAKITGSSAFLPQEDSDTGNAQTYALESQVEFDGETNSVMQIRIDATDYGGGTTDPKIHLALGFSKGTFTTNYTVNNKLLTAAAAHGLEVGDVIFLSSAGTLPGGLVQAIPYWVQVVPLPTTMIVAPSPAGSSSVLTSDGTGVHSYEGHSAASLTYENPPEGPSVPVIVKDRRAGKPDDFSRLKGIHLMLLPTDPALPCSGQVWMTLGVSTTPMSYFIVPLEIVSVEDPPASGTIVPTAPRAVATLALPVGAPYTDANKLTLQIEAAHNLTILLNLMGR